VSKPIARRTVSPRTGRRVHSLGKIEVRYEGCDDPVATRLPDISTGGMFINTPRSFPAGAVLDLRFRLELTGAEVRTRGEVRYCLPGVGVGVEFIDTPHQAVEAILAEMDAADQLKAANRKSSRRPKLVTHILK
jgi:hypothetical protein